MARHLEATLVELDPDRPKMRISDGADTSSVLDNGYKFNPTASSEPVERAIRCDHRADGLRRRLVLVDSVNPELDRETIDTLIRTVYVGHADCVEQACPALFP